MTLGHVDPESKHSQELVLQYSTLGVVFSYSCPQVFREICKMAGVIRDAQ